MSKPRSTNPTALLLASLVLAMAMGAAILVGLGLVQTDRATRADSVTTADTVGHGIGQVIDRALAHGVPLDGLVEMDPFLDQILADNHGIQSVTVRAADGSVLFARSRDGAEGPVRSSVPLSLDGETVGQVDIEVLPYLVLRGAGPFLAALTAGFLAMALIAVWIARYVMLIQWTLPYAGAQRVLVHGVRGDFRLAPPRRAAAAMGLYVRRLNRLVHAINLDKLRLTESAFAARAGHFDPTVLNDLEGLQRDVDDRYRFPGIGDPQPALRSRPAVLSVPLFLIILAEAMVLPSLLAVAPAESLALPALTTIAAAATVLLGARSLSISPALRVALTAGALTAVVGHLIAALAPGVAVLLAGRGLTGAGYGLVALGLYHGTTAWSGLNGGRAARGAVVAALAAGPMLGGLGSLVLTPSAAFVMAAVSTAAAVVVGWALLPTDVSTRAPEPTGEREALSTWPLLALPLALGLAVGALAISGLLQPSLGILPDPWNPMVIFGGFLSTAGVVAMLTLGLARRITPRIGRETVLVLGVVTLAFGMLPMILGTTEAGLAAAALTGCGIGAVLAPCGERLRAAGPLPLVAGLAAVPVAGLAGLEPDILVATAAVAILVLGLSSLRYRRRLPAGSLVSSGGQPA